MAPKKLTATTRSASNKLKQLENDITPLVERLHNICHAKVVETSWAIIWKEIKEWAYENGKLMEEAQKLSASTILSYMNVPLMEIFAGTKEIIAQFIVSRYHNGKFYFNGPIEISGDMIYRLIGLSNKGEPVLVRFS